MLGGRPEIAAIKNGTNTTSLGNLLRAITSPVTSGTSTAAHENRFDQACALLSPPLRKLVRLFPYLIPQPQGARKRKATAIDGDRRSSDLDPAATQEPPSKFQTIASVEISSTSMMMRWMKLLIRPLPDQHTGEPHPHLNFRMSPKSGLITPPNRDKDDRF